MKREGEDNVCKIGLQKRGDKNAEENFTLKKKTLTDIKPFQENISLNSVFQDPEVILHGSRSYVFFDRDLFSFVEKLFPAAYITDHMNIF